MSDLFACCWTMSYVDYAEMVQMRNWGLNLMPALATLMLGCRGPRLPR